MENGIQKGKDATSPYQFKLKSIFTKVLQFSGKVSQFKKKKNVLGLPFTILMGVGACMLKKEEVQLPLKFLQESTAYSQARWEKRPSFLNVLDPVS